MTNFMTLGAFMLLGSGAVAAPQTDNDPPEKKSLRDRFNVTVTVGSYHIGERDYQVSPEKLGTLERLPGDQSSHKPEAGQDYRYVHFNSGHPDNPPYWMVGTYDKEERRPWNEFNPGIGVNYEVNDWMHAGVGVYKNSIHNTSVYALVGAETDRSKFLGAGVEIGAVTGYSEGIAPSGVGFVRFGKESQFVNLKVSAIPPIPEVTPAVVAVQLRFNPSALKPK
jgi:hypothetical protein